MNPARKVFAAKRHESGNGDDVIVSHSGNKRDYDVITSPHSFFPCKGEEMFLTITACGYC